MTEQPNLNAALRNLLEEERRRTTGADEERKYELRSFITHRESELSDANLIQAYQNYLASLPEEIRPQSQLEVYRLFPGWEQSLKQELADWKSELYNLESTVPNSREIYNNSRERVLKALESATQEFGLISQTPPRPKAFVRTPVVENPSPVQSNAMEWMSFVELRSLVNTIPNGAISVNPVCFRDPQGNEILLNNLRDLFMQTAEWLIHENFLTSDKCPVTIGQSSRYIIHTKQIHSNGIAFQSPRRLSNGLYLGCAYKKKRLVRLCHRLLTKFGQDPAQFHVQLG